MTQPPSPSADLRIERLRLAYDTPRGPHTVVEGFDLALPAGRIGCLLGPSGCGKSTVLRAIAGFEPAREGEIRLGGRLLSSPAVHLPPEARQVGLMFQEYALFPHLDAAGGPGLNGEGALDLPTGRERRYQPLEIREVSGMGAELGLIAQCRPTEIQRSVRRQRGAR